MYPTIFNFGTIDVGPIHLPIAIHSYGLMMAIAFLTCLWLLQRELARKDLNPEMASSLIFAAAIGGIVGAKVYSALQTGDLSTLFSNSGLVWYGGLMGGTAAVIFVIYRSSQPILPIFDVVGMVGLLGYAIGRIGCFLSGDGDYGPPSEVPWAMAFPNGTVPTIERVHPTPLYEIGMSLIAFGLLWSIRKRKEDTSGWLFGAALVLAGVERFLAEIWRINPRVLFGLTAAQYFSFLSVIVGGWLLYWSSHQSHIPVEAANSFPPQPSSKRRRRRR